MGGHVDYLAFRRTAWRAGLVLTTAAILGLPGCAPHRSGPPDLADNSVITEDEIESAHAFNAYEAVYKLRREFLTSRGKLSLDPSVPPALPNVYVDNMFYGDVSTLRGIAAASIESIKFYEPAAAQFKFGTGNMAGVIGVTTKH
jgi:hypothetical protein